MFFDWHNKLYCPEQFLFNFFFNGIISILQLIKDICSTLLVLNIWNRYVCYSDKFFFFEHLKYLVFFAHLRLIQNVLIDFSIF